MLLHLHLWKRTVNGWNWEQTPSDNEYWNFCHLNLRSTLWTSENEGINVTSITWRGKEDENGTTRWSHDALKSDPIFHESCEVDIIFIPVSHNKDVGVVKNWNSCYASRWLEGVLQETENSHLCSREACASETAWLAPTLALLFCISKSRRDYSVFPLVWALRPGSCVLTLVY